MPDVRAHRAGSLFLRKRDGHWVASVTMPDGKRPTHGCRHVHRPRERPCDETKALLAELLRLRDAGAVRADPRLTVRDYLERWLSDVRPNLAPATWRKHEGIIRVHLAPRLGHVRLSELSVGDVRHYLASGSGNGQSLRHHRATLRRALADAYRDGLVTRNVAALAEPPKLQHRERPFLTAEQARTLIEGTRDDRLGPLFHLAVTTGMREAEILGLAWKDVELGAALPTQDGGSRIDGLHHGLQGRSDQGEGRSPIERPRDRDGALSDRSRTVAEGGPGSRRQGDRDDMDGRSAQVHVNATLHRQDGEWVLAEPKTPKSRRTIPLTAGCVAALREHRRRQLEERVSSGGKYPAFGLVFTTRTGQPMYGWHVLERLYAAEERLKLPKVALHGLRHSCASILLAEGVPLKVIAEILGHSSIRVTADLYAHAIPELSRDAMDRMQGAVG